MIPNGIRQIDYVHHSGLTKGAVSKLVSRGMPLTSLEAADQWRGIYGVKRPRGRPRKPEAPPAPEPTGQPPAVEAPPPAAKPPPEPEPPPTGRVDADTPEGAYERQRQIERAAYGLAVRALRAGQPDAGRLVQIHAAAARNLVEARAAVLELAEREGQLLSAEWVRRTFVQHDGAVVALAKAMPRLLAGRICPEDPERGETELARWVEDEFLRTLYSTAPWKTT